MTVDVLFDDMCRDVLAMDAGTAQYEIHVEGIPKPQGSHQAFNGRIVPAGTTKSRRAFKEWRTAVTRASRAQVGIKPWITEPVGVAILFRLPMPKSRNAARRAAGIGPHAVRADIDKLCRSTLDGMSDAFVWKDDSLVHILFARAVETTGPTGADILVMA